MKSRIPLVVSTTYSSWGDHTNPNGEFRTLSQNVVAEKDAGDSIVITQRPPLQRHITKPSIIGNTATGRGCYYWEKMDALLFVYGDTVYDGDYASPLEYTITQGVCPITFLEMQDVLVLLDPENGEGWILDSDGVLTQINDPDFPTTLAGGGAVLNQSVYVMDEEGTIYQSAINDPSSWNALDIISAEREPDKGLFLTKHKNGLVAVGSRTIEFFYDAANPQGSSLNRREDVTYKTGGYDKFSFTTLNDATFFVGAASSGEIGVYLLEDYTLKLVSTPSIVARLTSYKRSANIHTYLVAGGFVSGHTLVYITPVFVQYDVLQPVEKYSLVFDGNTELWHVFTTTLFSNRSVPIIQWADRLMGSVRNTLGMLINGDIIAYAPTSLATDRDGTPGYVQEGYMLNPDGYVVDGYEELSTIQCVVIPETFYGEEGSNNKFMHKAEMFGRFTSITDNEFATPFTVQWYDDDALGLDPLPVNSRQLSLLPRRKLTRLGKFNRREFKISFSGPERFRVGALEVDYDMSEYA